MASIPKMLVITPILQISKIPVLICHTIICSLTLLCLCGNVPHKTVGELPAHSHTATISTDGEHTHTAGSLGPIDGHSGNNYAKYHFADGKLVLQAVMLIHLEFLIQEIAKVTI